MNFFSDETYIDISSGKGGDGCVSFRREKFIPRGGPDGGDGGKGGDVVFVVRDNLRTLTHLKEKRSFKAENGRAGEGARCFGRNGKDVIIPVPPGTVIKDASSGDVIKDLEECERFVLLEGGRGGKGNWHFKSSVNRAPRQATKGAEGVTLRVGVEIRIIADIGLVGFPNAGKSSFINLYTNAKSKVASYPFTTTVPVLGVLTYRDRDIVIADIPGLMEGASEGVGMGEKFLRHISRTKGLIFLVDLTDEKYLTSYDILLSELGKAEASLAEKPSLILGTKIDEEGAGEKFKELEKKYKGKKVLPHSIYIEECMEGVKEEMFFLSRGGRVKGFNE